MSNVRRLPGPIADIWDWQRLGACRGRDSGQFFHPDGERGSSRSRREAKAKAVCLSCPVRAECATHALAVREPYGVWGGFTEGERLRLLATGWEDLVDLCRRLVDVGRLEARLGRPCSPAYDSSIGKHRHQVHHPAATPPPHTNGIPHQRTNGNGVPVQRANGSRDDGARPASGTRPASPELATAGRADSSPDLQLNSR